MAESFDSLTDVLAYLLESDYKIAKSTLYKHKNEGKLRPGKKGAFSKSEVDKYARTFLKNASGRTDSEEADLLQREKLESEARKLKAQAEHWELKSKIESGRYIDKDRFNGELAARASILKADLENFMRSSAAEMAHTVEGDQNKVPDLIDLMLAKLEIFLGRYAEPKEFEVKHDNQSD